MKTLGEIVRETRKSKNMSQEVLAEKIGVCKRTVIDIEKGTANPKFEVVYLLVRELNLPLDQVFYPELSNGSKLKELLAQEVNNCSEKEMKLMLAVVKSLRNAWENVE